jgi:hypothetical protein
MDRETASRESYAERRRRARHILEGRPPSPALRRFTLFIPIPVLLAVGLPLVLLLGWSLLAVSGRNLLPVPDPGSRLFAARSVAAQDALLAIIERHGPAQRFWGITPGVRRAILWDWTVLTVPDAGTLAKVDGAGGSLCLVADDPVGRAEEAAHFLRAHGFAARVVTEAEPEVPIAFVVTDALVGTTLGFRRHALRFPFPQPRSAAPRTLSAADVTREVARARPGAAPNT